MEWAWNYSPLFYVIYSMVEWRNTTICYSLDYVEKHYILLFVQLVIIYHSHCLYFVNWKEVFYLYFGSMELESLFTTKHTKIYFNVYISSGSNGISFLIWKSENWWKVGIWYFLMKGVFINSHTEIYVLNSNENTKLHSQH